MQKGSDVKSRSAFLAIDEACTTYKDPGDIRCRRLEIESIISMTTANISIAAHLGSYMHLSTAILGMFILVEQAFAITGRVVGKKSRLFDVVDSGIGRVMPRLVASER